MPLRVMYMPEQSTYTLAELKKIHDDLPSRVAQDLKFRSAFVIMDNLAQYHRQMHRLALQMALQHIHGKMPPSWQTGFAFALLGSGARGEQSIRSDQDHAFIYPIENEASPGDGDAYYQHLGEVTAAMLHQIGYPFCTGHIMASNARWRGTLSTWQERIINYADYPDWDNIRFLLIAADARTIIGESGLVANIRHSVAHSISRSPFIRWKVADQALSHPIALTLLGGIRSDPDPLHKGCFQVKEGFYTPLVNSVRLWALSLDIGEPSTKIRIEKLLLQKAWSAELAKQVTDALETALFVRLRHHVTKALQGQPIDDYVVIEQLSDEERDRIKRALRTTKQLQQITLRQFRRPG